MGQVEKADTVGLGHGRGRGHGRGLEHGHEPKFIFQPFSALCSVGQKLNIIHSLKVACFAYCFMSYLESAEVKGHVHI